MSETETTPPNTPADKNQPDSPGLTMARLKQAISVLAKIATAHGQMSEDEQAQVAELLS